MGRPGRGRKSSLFTSGKTTEMTQEQTCGENRVRGLRFHVYTFAVASSEKNLMQVKLDLHIAKAPMHPPDGITQWMHSEQIYKAKSLEIEPRTEFDLARTVHIAQALPPEGAGRDVPVRVGP